MMISSIFNIGGYRLVIFIYHANINCEIHLSGMLPQVLISVFVVSWMVSFCAMVKTWIMTTFVDFTGISWDI